MSPRSGYTLPVFACAAAIAALKYLQFKTSKTSQVFDPASDKPQSWNRAENPRQFDAIAIDLITPQTTVKIPIESVAMLKPNTALAITRSDPGDNLDLTRNTPVWGMVEWLSDQKVEYPDHSTDIPEQIHLVGGEGIGYDQQTGTAAIYSYARQLFQQNLKPLLTPEDKIQVTIILPEGQQLGQRTSNAAFGIVEGLSLLGTTGIAQPLSTSAQLEIYQTELQEKATQFDTLVFCLGENGLDLARSLGIPPEQTIKTANWLGPMLVTAALAGVRSMLLLGYHGKLIKLAGGIFHTHHYLADGRLEILTAHCGAVGVPLAHLPVIFKLETAESALNYLRDLTEPIIDIPTNLLPQEPLDLSQDSSPENLAKIKSKSPWVDRVYGAITSTIDRRVADYIWIHTQHQVTIGSVLFDRNRQIFSRSASGNTLLAKVCYPSRNNLS
ncbi:MAG: cobalt-precorrin-5B (C(1))-methyltransferase [Oscillatoriales cyanobacterium RM2_1_1]|nr:cobalt-precorrin-5B (C(1))-methyltransferase [Oscillatoriales cyanobacterium SM2_3_0]NJO45057.1 cobalt-precorrin-5B (C(1))-methyltransferase [Oscillatoriales cyanobacterium RM2_1_1]